MIIFFNHVCTNMASFLSNKNYIIVKGKANKYDMTSLGMEFRFCNHYGNGTKCAQR